jgi:hypothetical protein
MMTKNMIKKEAGLFRKKLVRPDDIPWNKISDLVFILAFIFINCISARAGQLRLEFSPEINRPWVGPDFYAHRLEDWRLYQGRIECLASVSNRYLYLLTGEVDRGPGALEIAMTVSVPDLPERPRARNYLGFRLGLKSQSGDFREAAVSGQGLEAGLTTEGLLFIGEMESVSSKEKQESLKRALKNGVEFGLVLKASSRQFNIRLTVREPESGKVLDELEDFNLPWEMVSGGLALVSSLPEVRQKSGAAVSWFRDLGAEGSLFLSFEERALGPVAFTLYTLSLKTLRLTAQLVPGCLVEGTRAFLDVRESGRWSRVAESPVDLNSWVACFKVPDWDYQESKEFRVIVEGLEQEPAKADIPMGVIRKESLTGDRLRLAVLSGNQEDGYPHAGLVKELKGLGPDLIFFGGHQVYGRPASFFKEKFSLNEARQEYLRQWLLFGWAFADLLKDRPSIILPEARDFFQTKLWGENGRLVEEESSGSDWIAAQDSGGFLMPEEFVRLVLKTQTSHLPERQGGRSSKDKINSYFCEVRYAGLSLAVVDDRTFRSAPAPLLPEARIRNGWALNPDFDLKKMTRVKGARLHSQEQLDFLKDWVADWSSGVWMKAVLSQSLWISLLTLPEGSPEEEALWKLKAVKEGQYPPDDRPAADFNSGGWPQSARDEALRILRQGLAIHIAGSGGPTAALKYGLEKFDEASWAFVPPALGNGLPVRWMPKPSGRLAALKEPEATGNFEDAFGNRFSLKVVTNPVEGEQLSPGKSLAGFGLVTFDKITRRITFESLARPEDARSPELKVYPGWPVAFSQLENEGRKPAAYLPLLKFRGLENPVVQVVEERTGQIVYSLRILGTEFRPAVFRAGNYTVRCGEPGTARWKEIKGIASLPGNVEKTRIIDFSSPDKLP